MVKQGTVAQVRAQEFNRSTSHIVVCMAFYPRGVKKEWINEYHSELAPDRELFKEWKSASEDVGHDEAFDLVRYEERFQLSPVALYQLKKLSEQSHDKDVYLICQCKIGEKCHREMLLAIAKQRYGAKIDKIYKSYETFAKRIPELNDKLKW